MRDFDVEVTFTGAFKDLPTWIEKEEKPKLLKFDSRAVSLTYTKKRRTIMFVNPNEEGT